MSLTATSAYNLAEFMALSTQQLTKTRVGKLVIGKAAVAFTVLQSISLFPSLQNALFKRSSTRPLLQWAKPSVIVAEGVRVAVHMACLKALEGRIPTGRFHSFQHLAIFFDSIFQYFIPGTLRRYITYVPLQASDALSIMTTLTPTEIRASMYAQAITNTASWTAAYLLQVYQKRNPSGLRLGLFQLFADNLVLSAVHYGSLTLATKYAPKSSLPMYLACWGSMYGVAAFSFGAIAGAFATPVTNLIDSFTGKGKLRDIPCDNLERLQYLSRFSALELASFFDLAVYILGGNFDNNCRLHVAKLLSDILQYQNAVMRDLIQKKREFPLHATRETVTADMMTTFGDAQCVYSGSDIKVGDEILVFSCGHFILASYEDEYNYEWCRGCPSTGGTIVVTVPDSARAEMTENLRKIEAVFFERWYQTHLIPDYLYYTPWNHVAAYCISTKIATEFEVSMISGDAQPTDAAWWDTLLDFMMMVMDLQPVEWNPTIYSTSAV